MPRYVLLEFEDNDKAKTLIERINGSYAAIDMPARGFRVKAVYAKPTKFCPPGCKGEHDKGTKPFVRAPKSGWWVHVTCGRPTWQWAKGNHWFSSLGRNLLPGNDDYVPAGYGVPHPLTHEQTGTIIPLGEDAGMPDGRGDRKAAARARRQARKARRPRVSD